MHISRRFSPVALPIERIARRKRCRENRIREEKGNGNEPPLPLSTSPSWIVCAVIQEKDILELVNRHSYSC